MKIKSVLSMGLVCAGLTVGGFTYTNASAKYVGRNSTPTELRGTWYRYEGHNKWDTYKITKKSVKYNGYLLYSTSKGGSNKLFIKPLNKKVTGGSGVSYILNGHFKNDDTFGEFWLSHQKVNGHRVLKNYHLMGQYNVFTKNKVKHNYSYHKDSFKDIGR